jgi:hypothetical protein
MVLRTIKTEIPKAPDFIFLNPDNLDLIDSDNSHLIDVFYSDVNYATLLKDPRTRAAIRIYDRNRKGVFKLFKVTRAGATTSLVIASYLRGEKCVVLVPTNKIADETIIADIEGIFEHITETKPPKIVHVYSNHHCTHYIKDQIEAKNAAIKAIGSMSEAYNAVQEAEVAGNEAEYKARKIEYDELKAEATELEAVCEALHKLKSVPRREDCGEECEYYTKCAFANVLRNPDADVIVATYDKIANLMLTVDIEGGNGDEDGEEEFGDGEEEKETVNQQIRNIIFSARNFIADETHWLEFIKPDGVTVRILEKAESWNEKKLARLAKFLPKIEEAKKYPEVAKTLRFIGQIISSVEVRETVDKTTESATDDEYYKKHIVNAITKKTYELMDNDETPLSSYPGIAVENYEMIKSKDFRKFKFPISYLNIIYDFCEIANAVLLQTSAVRGQELVRINLSDAKRIRTEALSTFFKAVQDMEGSRIILSTATFGTYNYNKLFYKGTKIKDIFFGRNGDPLNTTRKFAVFTHNISFTSKDDFYSHSIKGNLVEIVEIITMVLDEFGDDNCMVIAMNKATATLIRDSLEKAKHRHSVTWFRSIETVGVKSNYSRLSQNSNHFYNWIMSNVGFKFKS